MYHLAHRFEKNEAWTSAAYLENKVRVAFGDSATEAVWNILSQDDVVQRERNSRSMRQMRYRHGSRCTSVFMKQDHV